MKKRILYILNWDKYQARSDKELPWLKLWGRLFKAPWFQSLQDDEKFVTIALLDLARQFNNKIPEEMIFKEYLRGNYGVFMSPLRILKLSQVLVSNDFLSDNCPTFVEVEGDKIRQDKDKSDLVIEFLNYFNLKANKKLTLNDEREKIISSRLKVYTINQLKQAVDNFVKDTWPDRHKFMDIVYCIGIRNKIDNLEKWLNVNGGSQWVKP